MGIRIIVALVLLVAVVAGIFLLAQQGTKETQDLAWRTEQFLMRLIPPTGTGSIGEPTWLGLTIRRLAHIGEYALLGIASSVVALVLVGPTMSGVTLSLGLGLAASVADEVRKVFIPGRHFDAYDLLLDAVGYGCATMVVVGVTASLG